MCSAIAWNLSLRQRPHYAGGILIWKRSFIFLQLALPAVHTNPSPKRSFSPKTLFKPEGFENVCFSFSSGRKTFWKSSFSKTLASRELVWFLWLSFLQTQIQNDWCCVSKFLRRSVDGKHLMRFQSGTLLHAIAPLRTHHDFNLFQGHYACDMSYNNKN